MQYFSAPIYVLENYWKYLFCLSTLNNFNRPLTCHFGIETIKKSIKSKGWFSVFDFHWLNTIHVFNVFKAIKNMTMPGKILYAWIVTKHCHTMLDYIFYLLKHIISTPCCRKKGRIELRSSFKERLHRRSQFILFRHN